MTFHPPTWAPKLPFEIPDTVSLTEFMLTDNYGRYPLAKSRAPFICGLSGKAPTGPEVREQVEHLAKGLSKELGWSPNEGTEWDKVVAVFSVNTVSCVRSVSVQR